MRRLALVLALAGLPGLLDAQHVSPATAFPDSGALGARAGRTAAHGRARAPVYRLGGLLLGSWAGLVTPRILGGPEAGAWHVGFSATGVLAAAAATGSQGERSFLDQDSARIAGLSADYRYAYEDAYRAEFAAVRRREALLGAILFLAAATTIAAVRRN